MRNHDFGCVFRYLGNFSANFTFKMYSVLNISDNVLLEFFSDLLGQTVKYQLSEGQENELGVSPDDVLDKGPR